MKRKIFWAAFYVVAMVGIFVFVMAGEPTKAIAMVISAALCSLLFMNEMRGSV